MELLSRCMGRVPLPDDQGSRFQAGSQTQVLTLSADSGHAVQSEDSGLMGPIIQSDGYVMEALSQILSDGLVLG